MSKVAVIAQDCEQCIGYYKEHPGHVCPETTIDLYATIARLARIVEQQQKTLDHLVPNRDPLD